jgi:signal transduction histidine kinase
MAENLTISGIGQRRGTEGIGDPLDGERGMLLAITDVALSLSTAPAGTDIRRLVCERLWKITGAVVLSLTLFDEKTQSLRVHHSASSNRAYSTLLSIAGPVIFSRPYPVSDELYAYIMEHGDGVSEGCYELLHGQVPRPVCKILDRALGIGLAYGFGLTYGGELLGALSIMMPKSAPPLTADVMSAYSAIAAAALQQAKTSEQLHSYQSRLRSMSTRLHQAEESERRRIACSIHDNIAQSLVHLKLRIADAKTGPLTDPCQARLEGLSAHLDEIIREVYEVTYDLSPPVLYELGLRSALDWLIQGVQERDGISASLRWQADERVIPRELEIQAFHLVREMIRNVIKHARSENLLVEARFDGDMLTLNIIDDGVGFDRKAEAMDETSLTGGFGVFSVRERVRDLGGAFDILSAPGQGTRATIQLPLSHPAGETP